MRRPESIAKVAMARRLAVRLYVRLPAGRGPRCRAKKTSESTLRSERRSALKNNLTGPTLFEMSGYPTGGDEWAATLSQRERFVEVASAENGHTGT